LERFFVQRRKDKSLTLVNKHWARGRTGEKILKKFDNIIFETFVKIVDIVITLFSQKSAELGDDRFRGESVL